MDTSEFIGGEEARHFLASIVESSKDSIISVGFDGIITSWNAAAALLYGYSAAEAVGKPLTMLTLPEDLREILAKIDIIKHSRQVEIFETERIGKDGHHIFLEVTMSPVKNDDGEIIGVSTIARDITERNRTEKRTQVIFEIIQGIATTLDLNELLALIHESIKKVIYAKNCFVALYNKKTERFEMQFFVDKHDTAPPPFKMGKSQATYVFRHGHSLLTNEKISQQLAAAGEIELVGTAAASWLGVPLRTANEIIGVLVVQHYENAHAYSQNDVELLISVGDQIAAAIERKRVEEELKASEIMQRHLAERQSSILNALSAHICLLDRAGNIVEVNNEWKQFAIGNNYNGVNFEIGSNYIETCKNAVGDCSEGAKQAAEICRAVLSGESSYREMEYPCHSLDEERWFILQVNSLKDEQGGAVISHVNITARKKAEIQLENSEQFNRSIFENSPDCVKVLNLDGTLHSMNANGLCVMEIDDFDNFVGRVWVDFWEGEENKAARRAVEDARRGKVGHFEGFCRTAKGTMKYWDVFVAPILDATGKAVRLLSTSRDITESRQAAQKLELEGNFMQALMDNIPDAIYFKDTESRFLRVSRNVHLKGIDSPEQAVGKTDFDFFGERHARAAYEDEQRIIRTGQPIIDKEEMETFPDGSTGWVLTTKVPILDQNGKVTGIVGASRDITERKRMEEELEKTRDAALESARLKSEFLANMSHEIRTPMNGVIGMTGLLLDTDLDEEQRDFTETVRQSADSLLTIINDILDFSKIEAGQLHFELIDFDLRECVESVVELLAERAQMKGLEIASFLYKDVPSAVRSDPGRLRQILTNLIGNAVKFTESGEVTVSVKKENETEADVSLRFEITDTGIGISEKAQRRLFQAFAQADGSTTRKYGGTGLGLTISKQLVEMMGGEIGIISEPGAGSTFWFTARFEKQPAQVLPVNTATAASLEGLHILIVDDNRTNRRIFVHQTASWGMEATEAESGAQALSILRTAANERKPFDIAILDMMMPEMDGFELARHIKADSTISKTHLMLLPSYGKRGDGQIARDSGIAAYLQKPVRQSQLYNCLIKVISEASVENGSPDEQPARLITKYSIGKADPEAAAKQARILLAEDNIVNQKVASRQLKNLGYTADIVSNGRQAVEAVEKFGYDIVLMDCQMPEMDGYEATAEIRRREGAAKHTTIIAMTAHALEGEREKCLVAGMDDYISKPVKVEELEKMLANWLAVSAASAGETILPADAEKSHAPPVDMKRLISMMGDDPQELREIIDLYLEQMEKNLKTLRAAVKSGDASAIDLTAHNCHGSSANCGMISIVAPLRELERMGRENQLSGAPQCLAEVEREFDRVKIYLRENPA